MTASALAEAIDASEPTVYRRLEKLRENDLISAHQRVSPDGNHYRVFETDLERIVIELEDGGFTVEFSHHPADRFTDLWEEVGK